MVTKGNNIYIFNGGGVCFFSGKGGREKKLMHDLNSKYFKAVQPHFLVF